MPLLAAEAVLFVLLLALVVARAGAGAAEGAAAGAGALVVLLEFALDADVKEVGFLGAKVVVVVLTL